MKKTLTLISAFFCVSALFAADVVVADFDEVFPATSDVWGSEQTAEVATPTANAHGDALLMTTTANNSGNSGYWMGVPALDASYGTINFKMKSETSPCKFYIKLEFTDPVTAVKSTVSSDWPSYSATAGEWQDFSYDIAGKGVSALVIQMAPWQNAAAFDCYLDDVVLKAPTGIDEENASAISVLAANGSINVDLGDLSKAVVKIYSLNGSLVYNQAINKFAQIDAKNISGLVLVSVTTDNGVENFKVLVK